MNASKSKDYRTDPSDPFVTFLKTHGQFFALVLLVTLAFGCSRRDELPPTDSPGVSLGSGYKLYSSGGNTTLHNPGNVQLWYESKEGKQSLVWPYITADLQVFEDMIIFNGGLPDDKRMESYHLIAYSPKERPIEITECVTKDYCESNSLDYSLARGNYLYYVGHKTNSNLLELTGFAPNGKPGLPQAMKVIISTQQMRHWMNDGISNGIAKKYDEVEYLLANPAKNK